MKKNKILSTAASIISLAVSASMLKKLLDEERKKAPVKAINTVFEPQWWRDLLSELNIADDFIISNTATTITTATVRSSAGDRMTVVLPAAVVHQLSCCSVEEQSTVVRFLREFYLSGIYSSHRTYLADDDMRQVDNALDIIENKVPSAWNKKFERLGRAIAKHITGCVNY